MPIEIQLERHPDSSSEYSLDSTPITIRNRWSDRNLTWSIDVMENTGVEIVSGLKLLPRQSLIGLYVDDRLPPGELVVIGTFPTNDDLKFESLGDTLKLFYITEEELAS